MREHHDAGRVAFAFRHRVDGLVKEAGAVVGASGTALAPDGAARGVATHRTAGGEFEARGQALAVTSGGIGGGGMMGYSALKGTFLGGYLFSGRAGGRAAGRAAAADAG